MSEIKDLLREREELQKCTANQFGQLPTGTKNKITLIEKKIRELLDRAILQAKKCLQLPEFQEYKRTLCSLTDVIEDRILSLTGAELFTESERIKLYENMIRHQTLKSILVTVESDAKKKDRKVDNE